MVASSSLELLTLLDAAGLFAGPFEVLSVRPLSRRRLNDWCRPLTACATCSRTWETASG
jgi:hypothetical protein